MQQPDPKRRERIRLGAIYFCLYGALGALFPFVPLILRDRQLSAVQIGWLMTLLPVSMIFVAPLWGRIADRSGRRSKLLAVACLGTAVGCACFLGSRTVLGTTVAMVLFALMRSPHGALSDAVTHSGLGAERAQFGRIRLWGSVGFALAAFGVGHISRANVLLPASIAAMVLYLGAAGIALSARERAAANTSPPSRRGSRPWASGSMMLLLVATALHYTGQAAYDAFFALHLSALGFGEDVLGSAWAFGVLVEVFVMLLAPRLLSRYSSAGLLGVCALLASGRWLGVAHGGSQWELIAWQGLHGITFGLWYLALVHWVQTRSDEENRATMQSSVTSAIGAGSCLGMIAGGEIFSATGGPTLFIAAALCTLLAAAVYASLWRWDTSRDALKRPATAS